MISIAQKVILVMLLGASLNLSAHAEDPTQGPTPQAVGTYRSGRLMNATPLDEQGPGFVKLGYARNVHWGTYDLARVIEHASADFISQFPDATPVKILDLSHRRGGKFPPHGSHQIGLDVDIYYVTLGEAPGATVPQTTGALEWAQLKGYAVAPMDLERNWALFKSFVRTGRVGRIFVNQKVKRAFCEYAQKIGEAESEVETLRRLRPWQGHNAHFHVRLTCPDKSTKCIPQGDVPPGADC